MNKLNKLVTISREVADLWDDEDFQKRLKRVIKKKNADKMEPKDPKKYSSYIKFCIGERPHINKKYPDLSAKEITAKLGEEWNRYKEHDTQYLIDKYGYVPKVTKKVTPVKKVEDSEIVVQTDEN